jgi:DNA-binding response OmpR family regulator
LTNPEDFLNSSSDWPASTTSTTDPIGRGDFSGKSGTREGHRIALTVRQFGLLEFLMRHEGRVVVSRTLTRDILQEIRRSEPLDNVSTRTLPGSRKTRRQAAWR